MYRFQAQKGDPQVVRMRVVNEDDSLLEVGQVASMRLFVRDLESDEFTTPEGGVLLTVADCILEETAWDTDDDGFNVRYPVSGSYLPTANTSYQCEVLVEPGSGESYYLAHVVFDVVETYSYE